MLPLKSRPEPSGLTSIDFIAQEAFEFGLDNMSVFGKVLGPHKFVQRCVVKAQRFQSFDLQKNYGSNIKDFVQF